MPRLFTTGGFSLSYLDFLPQKVVFAIFGTLALVIFFGFYQRGLALILFVFWIIECNPVAFKFNPGTFMVAYLLLILAGTPTGPDWGIRKTPQQLCWLLLLALLFFDFFTGLQISLDLPAFGIRPDFQFRPPIFWLNFRLCSLGLFFLLVPFSRLRFYAWAILVGSNLAWLGRFGLQDSSLILLIGLLFLFNGQWLTESSDPKLKPIIFFDGFCVLCNRFTQFIFREDFAHHFFYSPLQGRTAKEILPRDRISQPHSIIFLQDGKVYEKSEAVLRILSEIGGIWSFFFLARVVPKALADRIYDLVASNRYSWFGSLSECQIPGDIEKAFQKP